MVMAGLRGEVQLETWGRSLGGRPGLAMKTGEPPARSRGWRMRQGGTEGSEDPQMRELLEKGRKQHP